MPHVYWIGETRIDLLHDGVFETSRDNLCHVAGDEARAKSLDRWGPGPLRLDVNAFLLRGPTGTALVDAGAGTDWGPAFGRAGAALQAAGVAPEEIDRVLVTHIHGDHVLGLVDGIRPTLPRAEILVPRDDLAFFTDPVQRAALPSARHGGFDAAERLVAAYAGRLRPISPGAVASGLTAVPLPGHTPGQVGYLLQDRDAALFLWADALHLDELQAEDPDTGLVYDLDPMTAAATRLSILARAAAEGWVVGGNHISGFRRVIAVDRGFRLPFA